MAISEFYQTGTGSNLNAGSTSADAASVTSTNGDWGNAAANRFTAASGTPFSGVSVGEWASIYLDAATSAVYVAQVTAVNGGGASIDLSTTNKIGTAPATGATGRSCKIGGAWADMAVWTSLFTTQTLAFAFKLWIKATTYSSTTTSRTFGLTGTATIPYFVQGYNTTPGDIDSNYALTKPLLSWTTSGVTFSGSYGRISNLNVTNAKNGVAFTLTGTYVHMARCDVENTGANANGGAISTASGDVFSDCWFKATSTATRVVNATAANTFLRCTVEGGGSGLDCSGVTVVASCRFLSNGVHGITAGVGTNISLIVVNSTIYNPGTDGIRLTTLGACGYVLLANNVISNCPGYGINNSTGTDSMIVKRVGNHFYSCTLGNETGFTDNAAILETTDTFSPFVNAAGGDLTLVNISAAYVAGGATFEGSSNVSYLDKGAIQHRNTSVINKIVNNYYFDPEGAF